MQTSKFLDNVWLKMDINVRHMDSLKILDEGEVEKTKQGEDRLVLKVLVMRAGEILAEKKFGLNKTNLKALNDLFGMESSAWVDKEVMVNRMMVRNPQDGKMTPSILVTAV